MIIKVSKSSKNAQKLVIRSITWMHGHTQSLHLWVCQINKNPNTVKKKQSVRKKKHGNADQHWVYTNRHVISMSIVFVPHRLVFSYYFVALIENNINKLFCSFESFCFVFFLLYSRVVSTPLLISSPTLVAATTESWFEYISITKTPKCVAIHRNSTSIPRKCGMTFSDQRTVK